MEKCSSGGGTARSDVCAHVQESSWLPLRFYIVIVGTNDLITIICYWNGIICHLQAMV